ncbi:type II toxin-antitoxin system PemK/MazF family toxin [Brevibacillus composti]|uniref:Type II toxin-antitoxin system PemK/MazF family toxin n=1 Tax=Brevibacillus composti TaxID=2796470 RepID=A0A7T5EKP3_9BACL|nr:type II toxin-antitoxin system PemK/MazF family toxin [Brevibacillus composti]QQE74410.1 type II toxin-antitoxin system PemK/MazF family toxin [Brevibacillus composti]QUO41492.1 type II toxin-antitoxin system PemK/MazF family toxin [Brevibacillus composti]
MPITGNVERGSVIWLNMHPTRGHEQNGWRAAIVLSDGLIDPENSSFAMIVPVTTQVKNYPFEVTVPSGIDTTHPRVPFTELSGVVLTDQAKSLDLSARNAVVIGNVDATSSFYKHVVTNVRSILA